MEPECWACVCGWFVNKMTNSSCQISLYSMLGVFLRSLCQHSEENVQTTLFETMSLELFADFLPCFFELLQVSSRVSLSRCGFLSMFLWTIASFPLWFFEPLLVSSRVSVATHAAYSMPANGVTSVFSWIKRNLLSTGLWCVLFCMTVASCSCPYHSERNFQFFESFELLE